MINLLKNSDHKLSYILLFKLSELTINKRYKHKDNHIFPIRTYHLIYVFIYSTNSIPT